MKKCPACETTKTVEESINNNSYTFIRCALCGLIIGGYTKKRKTDKIRRIKMKKNEKLKMMTLVMKFFSVTSYIMEWYTTASEDNILSKEEVAALGLGICEILNLKTDIELSD